ncbi:MAG: D-2-hydroxyacid dehydrogenase [Blastocatellia bacterium]|nr:D-2-hydroxyacid dehydrogenase [Blastocatellia bacterium]
MTKRKLKVWSNVSYPASAMGMLEEGLGDHQWVRSSGGAGELSEVDVAFGQPDPREAREAAGLKWIHLDSAGYDRFETPEMAEALRSRGGVLTNSSSIYDEPCAQHALAMMLSLARRLPQSQAVQAADRSWPMNELRADACLLNGQTVLVLGYGAIGRRLTELLAPFEMQVIGLRRRPTGDEAAQMISEAQLDEALSQADHVLNILPGGEATRRYMDAAKFGRMKPGAIFYNIGRGSTVDQEALRETLDAGHLAAAFLDVTDPEPLPPDHPLWTTRNCHITPHTAGGHIGEKERLVRHFLKNLARFLANEPLNDRVL